MADFRLRQAGYTTVEGMSGMSPSWRAGFERTMLHVIALGGLASGLGGLVVGPAGVDGTDVLSLLALVIGVGALAGLLVNRTDPVPILVVIVVLVGSVSPFVDGATAMALSAVVVGVTATGVLLIERSQGAVALIGLGLIAVAVGPVLDAVGLVAPVPLGFTAGMPWVVAIVAVLATALGFRALRDQLIREEEHQRRVLELAENTACQIKGPLASALGYAYLLRAALPSGEAAEYADRLIKRGWEVSLGVDDLTFVSLTNVTDLDLNSKPVELESAVNSCLDEVIGARVKLIKHQVSGTVLGDPIRVRQVIRHLISNAVLHGGPEVSVASVRQVHNCELRVHDNGAPLDQGAIDRMFQPFVKLRADDVRGGRGVGLAVSKTLAAAMGGTLRFESSPGGNTAVLTLRAGPDSRLGAVETVRLHSRTDPYPV